ncbi:MAG: hypothetical protein OXH86_06570 [Acidimicrobiaceae bacterium]|nr:hypothetical protein [Acidimicrobiaceae bacterium]
MSSIPIALSAARGGNRALIVVSHLGDSGASAALDVWQELSAAAHLSEVLCVDVSAGAADSPDALDRGRSARILQRGEWSDAGLMYTLHGLGELRRIDVVSFCTAALDDCGRSDLVSADARLRADVLRIAAEHTSVLLHRVWLPDYGDDCMTVPPSVADAEADALYVVLPVDRQFDRAAAMPVSTSSAASAHGWHVAVEIASLSGMWSTMSGCPLEFADSAHSGTGLPLVRLVRSMCRAARIRAPSPDQTLEHHRVLPLPPGFVPMPDPHRAAEAAAKLAYPAVFRGSTSRNDGEADTAEPDLGAIERVALMPQSEGAGVRRLAVEAVHGVLIRHRDMATAALELDMYARRTAEVAPWTSALIDEAGDIIDTDDAISRARSLLAQQRAPVSIDAVPSWGWEEMLARALGVADAAQQADDLRAAVSGVRYVVIEPEALAPTAGDLASAVLALEAPIPGLGGEGARGFGAAAEGTDADIADEHGGQLRDDVGLDTWDESWRDAAEPEHRPTLLRSLTAEFDHEIARSHFDETERIRQLRDHLHSDRQPQPGVTAFVGFSLLAAVMLGIGAVLTLTGLREYVTPDHLSDVMRFRAFGLAALVASLPPMLRFTPSRSFGAQVWLTLVAAVYSVLGAGIIVLAPQLLGSFLSRPGRWVPAVVVVSAVLALAVVAWVWGSGRNRALLGRVEPLTSDLVAGSVPLVYLFAMGVAAFNFDASAPPIFERQDGRLLTVLLVTASVVALVCGNLVRIVRRRDRDHVGVWKDRIDELVDQCELASARISVLATLKAHWLITAAVVSRLVHQPFGRRSHGPAAGTASPQVRKLLMFDLELSDRTREAFLGEMLPLLAPRGWLREQHRKMAAQFAESERRRLGITEQQGLAPPEQCTYPLSLESVRRGEAQGFRWRFAEQCYAGEFDALLGESVDDAVTNAMQATFMDERAMVSMASLDTEARSLPSLLAELLPSGEMRLPSGTLPPSTEGAPRFDPYLWWPTDVALPPDVEPSGLTCGYLRDGGSVIFHALRVDVSEPLPLDRLVPHPSAARTESGAAAASAASAPGRRDATPDPLM